MLKELIAIGVCGLAPATAWCGAPSIIQLLTDPAWERGFEIIAPQDHTEVQGLLQHKPATAAPAWRLVQWTSRLTIAGIAPQYRDDGSLRVANDAKAVTLGPAQGPARGVSLRMHGGFEYDGRLRQRHEPWPHLLIEQPITGAPPLGAMVSLRFRLACQLRLSEVKSTLPMESWHCAQFQAFVTVADSNPASPGQGDFFWFGIPIYDSRYRQPIEHASRDTAGSRRFIFTPAGSVYADQAAADGQWLTIDHDLLPLIQEGFERARRAGFMKDSSHRGDLRITSLNLGWELTGPLDVEMHCRDLNLAATVQDEG